MKQHEFVSKGLHGPGRGQIAQAAVHDTRLPSACPLRCGSCQGQAVGRRGTKGIQFDFALAELERIDRARAIRHAVAV
jgi:hypothetical protein